MVKVGQQQKLVRARIKRTKLIILAGIFWLALLLGMTLSDYITRVDYRGVRFPMTQVVQQFPAQRA